MLAVSPGDSIRGRWRIGLFQETPAAWHGHEDARQALLVELRGQLAPQ